MEAAAGGKYAGAPSLSNEYGSMPHTLPMLSSLLVICGERTWCALGLGFRAGVYCYIYPLG